MTLLITPKKILWLKLGSVFLLAGLDDDPVVKKARAAIARAVDKKHGMIPSVSGDFDFAYGEHRNVLAIMLLDWRAPYIGPNVSSDPKLFKQLPYGVRPDIYKQNKNASSGFIHC
jgi:hypothetical protein